MNADINAEEIFSDIVLNIENKKINLNMEISEEKFLEILTLDIIYRARKEGSKILLLKLKKILREYLLRYSPYELDQNEIIDFYLERAEKNFRKEKVQQLLLSFDVTDPAKIEENIKKLNKYKNMLENLDNTESKSIEEVLKDNLKNGFEIGGIQTRIDNIDNIIDGFGNEELIIIAARPGVGKTAFLCQLVSNISRDNRVGIFSLEMDAKLIVNRILACVSGIDSKRLSRINENNYNFLTNQEKEMIALKADQLSKRIVEIVDIPNLNIDLLLEKATKMKKDYKIDILLIDYLTLITTKQMENRRAEITYITRNLKGLARELKIPVICLAQLNREAQQKRAALDNLKESGSIEEDADMIIFLQEDDLKNTEIVIAKNRNGKTGMTRMKHLKSISRFVKI